MSNQSVSVIYQDPNGQSRQGYIIGGKTYKDQAGTQRVDVGSTVPTQGGTYTLTTSGGVKTPGSIGSDLQSAYTALRNHLTKSHNSRKDAIEASTRKAYAQIEDQRRDAQRRYEDSNRAAYGAYVSASNPYGAAAESLAKAGLSNSGYAESSKVNLANTYQTALSQNARDKNLYMQELDAAYRDAKSKGETDLANAIAEYEMLVYQHGIDAAEAIAKQQNLAYETSINADRERNDELWNRAYKLAASGFSNAQIASILGVSLNELNAVINRR